MKYLISYLFIFLSSAQAIELPKFLMVPKSRAHIKMILSRLSERDLEKRLRDFIKCCRPSRMAGTSGHRQSSNYLFNTIKKIDSKNTGITVIDSFNPDIDSAIKLFQSDFDTKVGNQLKMPLKDYKKWQGYTNSMIKTLKNLKGLKGRNIIWEKKGFINSNDVITISAHYDSIAFHKSSGVISSKRQYGADDNGSGVAMGIALIDILSSIELPKTVRVVFFDFEEMGNLGSKAYIKKYLNEMKKQNFAGLINLEMLGHDSKTYDKDKKLGNFKAYIKDAPQSSKLYNRLDSVASTLSSKVKFELDNKTTHQFSSTNFWNAGLTSITYSQNLERDINPRHHTTDDFVETLNLKTWYSSFQYIGSAIISWVFDIL